ncbi:hypothetical protein LRC484719_49850 [Mycobacterium riyadhense]
MAGRGAPARRDWESCNQRIPGRVELPEQKFSVTGVADSLAEQLRAVERPFLSEEGSQRIAFPFG